MLRSLLSNNLGNFGGVIKGVERLFCGLAPKSFTDTFIDGSLGEMLKIQVRTFIDCHRCPER
jgi:hypothetical protein